MAKQRQQQQQSEFFDFWSVNRQGKLIAVRKEVGGESVLLSAWEQGKGNIAISLSLAELLELRDKINILADFLLLLQKRKLEGES